jgi:hypothetical protein
MAALENDSWASRFRGGEARVTALKSTLFVVFLVGEVFVCLVAVGMFVGCVVEIGSDDLDVATVVLFAIGWALTTALAVFLYMVAWKSTEQGCEVAILLLELATGQRDHTLMARKKMEFEPADPTETEAQKFRRCLQAQGARSRATVLELTGGDRSRTVKSKGNIKNTDVKPMPLLSDAEIAAELTKQGLPFTDENAAKLLEEQMRENLRSLVLANTELIGEPLTDVIFGTVKLLLYLTPFALQIAGIALVVSGQVGDPKSTAMTVAGAVLLAISPLALCFACVISMCLKAMVTKALETALKVAFAANDRSRARRQVSDV